MNDEASGSTPILQMRDIRKAYGPVRVLEDVNLELSTGEVRCLAGENGSGKSTLIKILSGVVSADAGQVSLNGRQLGNDPMGAITAGLSVIYQDFSLFPNLSVWENIGFLTSVTSADVLHKRSARRRLAIDTLKRMQVEIDPDTPVELLPVASKQLVAIARALANRARIIVMDEPTTALTRSEVAHLLEIVGALKKEGVSFLFVSHKIEEVFAVCDTVTVLRDGSVVVEGPIGEFDTERLVEAMTGRSVDSQRLPREEGAVQRPFLAASGLGRRGNFVDVDLELRPGEIVSVVGLLGSGRTELAQTLFGYMKPDAGRIEIDGEAVTFKSQHDAIERGIAYVPEDRLTEGLFLNQSIRDNITVSSLEKSTHFGIVSAASLLQRARDAVKNLRIKTPDVTPAVATLSGGNQQRVVLARWMEIDPRLLILNGPTVGVDVGSKREIHELLVSLSRSGTAVMVVTDDIAEAIALSDRILVMVRGRITAGFDAATVDEDTLYNEVIREDRT
ncbi:sugar ABC transporter ATP-binding protein [Nitratireductor aquimarinus]|uniref:sugar ABC transporter ATP-binding protein n=1 Tax=Nitratireductor TaxID=245876 RepID=UPI0019D3A6E8|nr:MULTISPECIES: sugar ABC transporter ATP-binding protein [Nitratireductor]MBN7775138.1 sugar ABC transporter ATP-binding protein [Nitratireductor pacificus]MBN7781152.1 sugar ABC transporter ATP-binding protein [Nitratireductor pacificus]MBN7789958.1 sugar ABC transporter ATP-binding protein [Nitratireductor aquimarinus]MBY6097525.1 sugar ABC transporter ATP-binding protein [Nitratireductor aquimarinus]MCA1260491.1 sugar ABC transporter ATP-binding protein [Nitratireductor aquimarinus]